MPFSAAQHEKMTAKSASFHLSTSVKEQATLGQNLSPYATSAAQAPRQASSEIKSQRPMGLTPQKRGTRALKALGQASRCTPLGAMGGEKRCKSSTRICGGGEGALRAGGKAKELEALCGALCVCHLPSQLHVSSSGKA